MNDIFIFILHNALMCGISGTVMLLLSMAAGTVLKKRSMEYYLMLIASVILFLCPFSAFFEIPKAVEIPADAVGNIAAGVRQYGTVTDIAAAEPHMTLSGVIEPTTVIFAVWSLAALFMIIKNIICYIRFLREIKAGCKPVSDERVIDMYENVKRGMNIRRRVRLMVSGELSSPMLFGIFRPMLIMPCRKFDDAGLRMIMTHELTHFKHGDIIVKQLALLAVCMHWYNPAAYILCRKINAGCELCCDEAVLGSLKLSDHKEYGRLLLSVMENTQTGIGAYSTSMSSSKKNIKKRLRKIVEFKEATRVIKAVGIITALCMSLCSVTAFGFSKAAEIVPEPAAPIFKAPEIVPEKAVKPMPEKTEEPEPEPVPAVTPEPTETPEKSTVPPAAEPEPTPKTYVFTVEDAVEASPEPEPAEAETAQAPEVMEVSRGVSVIFNPVFENGECRQRLYAAQDTKVTILSAGEDIIRLYLDGQPVAEKSRGISFSAHAGEEYEAVIMNAEEKNSQVYIYCD